ncbi:MAG: polysaccharide deacetylase family protein [Bacteroidales bacterium]
MNEIQKNVNDQNDRPSISISFDFETSAQSSTPIYRTKLKSLFFKVTNHIGLTNKDLSAGLGRGYGNRIGAEKILKIFNQYGTKATWFCTGHVLLKENRDRQAFRINQKLPYAFAEAGFTAATTWRVEQKSFYHEPFTNYKKQPYYYLGDLAEEMKHQGQDFQCHSFSHPYISMESPENIKTDLEDWQQLAEKEGFEKSNIFAFPFLGDYHFTDRTNGLKTVSPSAKTGNAYEISYLNDNVLKIFKNAGFELFTRCGSMSASAMIQVFSKYQNSDIYCMKDIPLLSFQTRESFREFVEKLIGNKANIDLWLHPNDIMLPERFELFKSFIKELVQFRDEGKIWLCTISEQWNRFKKEKLEFRS